MGPLAVIGMGASAAGSAVGAYGSAQASMAESERHLHSAQRGLIRAEQTETLLREEFADTLGNIRAVRGAAGVDGSSPTSLALEKEARRRAEREIDTRYANEMADAREAAAASRAKKRGAYMTLAAGGLGTAGKLSSDYAAGMKSGLIK
jgi:hypothetical protein